MIRDGGIYFLKEPNMLLLDTNRKSYLGSLIAPLHLTWVSLKVNFQGRLGLRAYIS